MSNKQQQPSLTHKHIFGLKGDVKNNIWYTDENVVVYPCGHNSVIYNTETREQHFIHGADSSTFVSEGITALSITPNKRHLAVAEQSERPAINMYDLTTYRRRKVLSFPELGSNQFTSLAFSADNKCCLTQGGAPDWTLVSWAWEKAKVLASAKVSNANGGAINQADYCPGDPNVVCVSGNGILKFFKIADGQFKPVQAAIKRDPQNYLCHCWLGDDRVVVATDTGDLLLFDNFEFKMVLANPTDGADESIDCIVPYSKGFVCGGANGTLRVYERSDDAREYYKRSKVFKIEGNLCRITNLAISPSEDNMACSLENHQMYVLGLSNTDILKEDVMNFELLSTSFHAPGDGGDPQITGLDTCIRKPLVATCGLDKSVRVWNYLEKTTDLHKTFKEEAYCVAFHPSGLHIVVGFMDKLRLLNLLMDDIRPVKEFNIKACNECRFSNGGQYFAAVNNNTVQIFHTYSTELVTTLRGHSSKVRSVCWKNNDKQLYTCGMDGMCLLWDLRHGTKISETVVSRVNLACVASSNDPTSTYVSGNDDKIKEIDFSSGGTIKCDLESNLPVGELHLSASGKILFAGVAGSGRPGVIRAYNLPLGQNDYKEYQCHASAITRIRMSHDGQFLFTAAEDGSLCVLEVKEAGEKKPAKGRERENPLQFAEEILVTKSDLEEKTQLMQELKAKVDELTLHNEYQLRLKDMNYKEKIKEVTDKFTSELAHDRTRYDDLVEEKREMELEYEERLGELEQKHTTELRQVKATYESKISAEQNRFTQLVQERDEQNLRWDDENQLLVESHQQYLGELTADYDRKVQEEQEGQGRLAQEKDQLMTEHEEMMKLIEEDADMEVEEVKEKNEAKLNAEREATLRLKGENGIMKKKFGALQKDIEDQKEEIRSLHEKEKELYESIKGLEKDIQGHKKEIREREETIQDKEKRIYDLKKKNQELEKFKFVLDYKIKELKRQIEPREKEIADMRQQIEEMDQELEQYHKSNAALDLMIGELRLKMDGMQREINEQREQLGSGDALIRRFRADLHECVQYLSDHKSLKRAVTSLYKKYVQDQGAADPGVEADVQREYNRQREYLERSVESLKRKLAKDMAMHHTENSRLMRENSALTCEINTLRRELKNMGEEAAISNAGGSQMGGMGMLEDGPMGDMQDEAMWREAELQQLQINEMTATLQALQQEAGMTADTAGKMRPGSRERLPPMGSSDYEDMGSAPV